MLLDGVIKRAPYASAVAEYSAEDHGMKKRKSTLATRAELRCILWYLYCKFCPKSPVL